MVVVALVVLFTLARSLRNVEPVETPYDIVDHARQRLLDHAAADLREKKQRVERAAAIAADDQREETVDILTRESRLGREIRDLIRSSGKVGLPQYESVCRDWANGVHRILQERLPTTAEWFMDEHVEGGQQRQPGASFEVANWGNYMDRRLTKLAHIIRELGDRE